MRKDKSVWGTSFSGTDVAWVFGLTITNQCIACTPEELAYAFQFITCHEWAHILKVNCSGGSGLEANKHDANSAWCGNCGGSDTEKCIMHVEEQLLVDRIDGIDRFDCYNLLQLDCGETTKCGEGIRVGKDPT